jgi:RNA polymerase sigma-70 factor (ECF subfamily)
MENDEKILIERLIRGDELAFRDLVEQNKKKIFYLAYDFTGNMHDAEDISQEVFIKVYSRMKTFKRDSKLSSWLYRITINACIDKYRKKSVFHKKFQVDKELEELPYDSFEQGKIEESPEMLVEAQSIQRDISEALKKVSARERSVFILRHYNHLSLNDISEILGISVGAVKSFLFRAIQKLRKELSIYRPNFKMEVSND